MKYYKLKVVCIELYNYYGLYYETSHQATTRKLYGSIYIIIITVGTFS